MVRSANPNTSAEMQRPLASSNPSPPPPSASTANPTTTTTTATSTTPTTIVTSTAPSSSVGPTPTLTTQPTRLFGVTLPTPSKLPRGSGPFGSSQPASFRAPPPNPSFCRYTPPSTEPTRVVKIAPRPRPPTIYRTPISSIAGSTHVPMPIAPPRIRPTFPTFASQPSTTFNPVIRVLNRPNINSPIGVPPRNITAMSSHAAQSALAIHPQIQHIHQRNSNVSIQNTSLTPHGTTQSIAPAPPQPTLRSIQHIHVQQQVNQHQVSRTRDDGSAIIAHVSNRQTPGRSYVTGPTSSLGNSQNQDTSHSENPRQVTRGTPSVVRQDTNSSAVPINRAPIPRVQQVPVYVPASGTLVKEPNQSTPIRGFRGQLHQVGGVAIHSAKGAPILESAPVTLPRSNSQCHSASQQHQQDEITALPPRTSFARPQTITPRQPAVVAREPAKDLPSSRAELMTRLDDVARALRSLWYHPPHQQQVDTLMLHRLRALFAIDPSISRSRVARECSVRKQSISLYLRGRFRGKQDMLERKIATLIVGYFEPGAVADRAEKRRAEFAKIELLSESQLAIGDTLKEEETAGKIMETAVQKIEETDKNHLTPVPNATVSPTKTPPPRPLSRKASLMQSDINYHTLRGTLYVNDGPIGGLRRATRRVCKSNVVDEPKDQEEKREGRRTETRALAAKRKQMAEEANKPRRSARHVRPTELPPSKRLRK